MLVIISFILNLFIDLKCKNTQFSVNVYEYNNLYCMFKNDI